MRLTVERIDPFSALIAALDGFYGAEDVEVVGDGGLAKLQFLGELANGQAFWLLAEDADELIAALRAADLEAVRAELFFGDDISGKP